MVADEDMAGGEELSVIRDEFLAAQNLFRRYTYHIHVATDISPLYAKHTFYS